MQIKQRILAVLATFTLIGMAPVAFAEIKLAVVDVQSAILNSENAKKITAQIQGEFTREQDSIKKTISKPIIQPMERGIKTLKKVNLLT